MNREEYRDFVFAVIQDARRHDPDIIKAKAENKRLREALEKIVYWADNNKTVEAIADEALTAGEVLHTSQHDHVATETVSAAPSEHDTPCPNCTENKQLREAINKALAISTNSYFSSYNCVQDMVAVLKAGRDG